MYRKLYLPGVIAYCIMLVFSILFYKERIILTDTANSLFYLIQNNQFVIAIYRFGNLFTQVLPLLAIKTGVSLDIIMASYSLNFILYYFTCYFICGSILKRFDFALIILLLNILFAADTFYWIPSELPMGIALWMVILSLCGTRQLNNLGLFKWTLLIPALITLVFFHPLLVVPVIFTFIFLLSRKDLFHDKRLLYFLLAFYFTTTIVKQIFFKTTYEHHSFSGLKNFITEFPDYFTLYSNRRFLHNCVTKYYWIPIIFTCIAVFYTKTKQWKTLLLFVSSFTGYLLLVNITYPHANTPVFYIENLYLPLALFLALPFTFDILPLLAKHNVALPVFALILITGCIRLFTTHHTYTSRLNWERRFLDEHAGKKKIYRATNVPVDTLQMIWGTPYEFWLLSTTERGQTASLIIDDKPEERIWASDLKKSFVVNWNVIPYEKLNPRYFKLTDTTSGYLIY